MKKKKLAQGGTVQNIVSRPSMYLSVPYVERRPDLPNLGAIEYLEKRKAATDDKIARERAALMPDQERMDKLLGDLDALEGAGLSYTNELQNMIGSYSSKASQDEWFVFSPEGRQQYQQIQQHLNPGNFNLMKRQKETVKSQYDKAENRKLLGNVWVDNGYVMAKDVQTGENKRMSIQDWSQNYKGTHALMKHSDLYNERIGLDWRQTSGIAIGDAMTANEAWEEMRKYYTGLGHNVNESDPQLGISPATRKHLANLNLNPSDPNFAQQVVTKIKRNDPQIQAAMAEMVNALPQKVRDALMADMLVKGQDASEFDSFLNQIAKAEGQKNRIYEQTTNYQGLGLGGGGNDQMLGDWLNNSATGDANFKEWNARKQAMITPDGKKGVFPVYVSPGLTPETRKELDLNLPHVPAKKVYKIAHNMADMDTQKFQNWRDPNEVLNLVRVDEPDGEGGVKGVTYIEKYLYTFGDDNEAEKIEVDYFDEKSQKVKTVKPFDNWVAPDNRTKEGKAIGFEQVMLDEETAKKMGFPTDLYGNTEVYRIKVREELTQEMINQIRHKKDQYEYSAKQRAEQQQKDAEKARRDDIFNRNMMPK